MKRGDLVIISPPGAYGKPRPALVIQSDMFSNHTSVTLLPLTSELRAAPIFRIEVNPTKENGLQKVSQVMIDKLITLPTDKVGTVVGRIDDTVMLAINRALTVWLGFA